MRTAAGPRTLQHLVRTVIPRTSACRFSRWFAPFKRTTLPLLCFLLMLPASMAPAYNFIGSKWPVPRAIFYVDFPEGFIWTAAFENAMNQWNAETDFEFQIVRRSVDPCIDPNLQAPMNGVSFSDTNCDEAFGSAIALMAGFSAPASPFVQTRILFNDAVWWGIYDGPTIASTRGRIDFRRTALHELGHALGLAHEDRKPSIMRSFDSDVFSLQRDDLAAVAALYAPGGPNPDGDDHGDTPATARHADANSVTPGKFEQPEDVEFFRIRLLTSGFLNIGTTGAQDTVGVLFDSSFDTIDQNDDAGAGNTNFNIGMNLEAGTYYVLVLPFGDPAQNTVSIVGDGGYSFYSEFLGDTEPEVPRVNLSGNVIDQNGDALCAMVLASGVYQFTCNPTGPYELKELPREVEGPNVGKVKRAVYADGFYPTVHVVDDSLEETIVMRKASNCPDFTETYTPSVNPESEGRRIDISGRVFDQLDRDVVCSMVLANGQYTFTCDGTGNYSLNVPLDANGQYKLAVYAQGFAPKVRLYDEARTSHTIRLTRANRCRP